MGIQGLLPFLRSIQRESHLKDWAGKTLAIDGYVWLHRGAYHCAQDLCLGNPTTKHVDYFMQKINLLLQFGVSPYVVFDGDHLPSKKATETDRANRRQTALANAHRSLAQGDHRRAREEFIKAVDVTPQLAHDVILALRAIGAKYVVAPYEADAQLRYLEMQGEVDAIITEDSDLLVYGARNVLFKMDPSGHCIHICRDEFGLVEDKRMASWTEQEFRQMAMLSGCDYLSSIPGLGIKKAHDLIRRHKTADRAIKATRLDGKLSVPPKYEQSFREAELTFQHQYVYDPTARAMVPLTPLPEPPPSPELLSGCGQKWPDELVVDVAEGRVDPVTKQAFSPKAAALKNGSPRRTSKILASEKSAEKRPALSSGKQSTLNQFAFKQSNSNTKALSATPVRPSARSSNPDNPPGPTRPEPGTGKPSKFFECQSSKHADPSSCLPAPEPDSESQGFIATQTTIEDLSPEDAVPLTQEDWDAVSEMSSDGAARAMSEDLQRETEFDELVGEDLPSSQMHDVPISSISRAPLQPCISSSSISSNFTDCNKENRPPTFQDDPLDASVCASSSQEIVYRPGRQDLSDDVISSSEPEEGDLTITSSKSRVQIITPRNHHSAALVLDCRRVSEPISRQTRHFPLSSDPILSSDTEQKAKARVLGNGGLTRRKGIQSTTTSHSHQPPKRVCRGFIDTPTSKLSNGIKRSASTATPPEDMSPSLARVASGIRSRFAYQKPASADRRPLVGTPKLFDLTKTHPVRDDDGKNRTGSRNRAAQQPSSRGSCQLPLASMASDTCGNAESEPASNNPPQACLPFNRHPSVRTSAVCKLGPAVARSPAPPPPVSSSNKLAMFRFRGNLDRPPPNPV